MRYTDSARALLRPLNSPSDEICSTTTGRFTTRVMNRTRPLPKLSRLYRFGVQLLRPWPRRSAAHPAPRP
ncbi:hypothetical protein [Streptomyces tendae]|uniref:hypothetical protein n=1 Tax=Streptomyces tendae TaxID=1932 RepID=UPI00167189B4|nr:hypothetical protein [Streptomyces tendae]